MSSIAALEAAQSETRRLGKFIRAWDPKIQGAKDASPRIITEGGLIKELDVPIRLRDGVVVYGNISRHESWATTKLPVIFNYSVYGKDGGTDISIFPAAAGLDPSRVTKDYLFEAADAGWWCPRGYAVASIDGRGSYQSDGNKSYYSRDVGMDGYDMVEWLSAQGWSNGKVALYGSSGYAMLQWLTAAEKPPSLAAIIPIDGMTDIYREMARKGGIPEIQFNTLYPFFFNWGRGMVEDPMDGPSNHAYFDEYWQSKVVALDKIECPAYIICSWGDHGIHTRGTINGYYGIRSKVKYLELHQHQKWEWSVTEESLLRQKAFLDTYLMGKQTEVQFWPPVRYVVRERYYVGEWRFADRFPLPETQYTKFFPVASRGLSRIATPIASSISYDAREDELSLDLPIVQPLEFVGHAKLKLWVEAKGAENMDLFITLRKTDANGNEVFFPWLTIVDTGPIAFGWLRVSRRELDEKKSKPWQPYHTHQRDLPPLKPGEVVPVEIEIQPTSCRLRRGERLHLVISGHDYRENAYPKMAPIARHPETVNSGTHVVHFGGQYDSHLLLPVLPHVPRSYLREKGPIKMSLLARRLEGWSDEKFMDEYTGKHAKMTNEVAAAVPALRNYTQVVAFPQSEKKGAQIGIHSSWDCCTTLGWTSLGALWGSFQHPQYKATAGTHVFVDEEDTIGILSQPFLDLNFDPVSYENRRHGVLLVRFLAKSAQYSEGEDYLRDLRARALALEEKGAGTSLLRYALNRTVTPDDVGSFFAGTPFNTADWTTIVAMEQFWFSSWAAVLEFFRGQGVREAILTLPGSFDGGKSLELIGNENIVVHKDIEF
ncbi:hypothetical protein JX265_013526 [Neoarthrinium moseri]|uniref:Xaa-Pro dipeptidyl-peptidase C-terminal domain-containing protein n=1 Tax=Neoarthrinium moseri TaxID=1658444 RepID=A0A9P9W892_9PEZI|nr:hypothetical protein JX266_013753 [Neoarthrinium moseri]KAI1849879.1 hypothetical protein JX265_013526 [Neoarthrinium moseri]